MRSCEIVVGLVILTAQVPSSAFAVNSGTIGAAGAAVGSPCTQNTDCASALCGQDSNLNETYCTQMCAMGQANACPSGMQCQLTSSGSSYCVLAQTPSDLCDPCNANTQCSTGFCTTVTNYNNAQPFCSTPCDPTPGQTAQCPSGYSCLAVQGAAGGACAPNTGLCNPVGTGAQDQPCYSNGTCANGYSCIPYQPASGPNYCYFTCAAQYVGQSCDAQGATLCTPVQGQMGVDVCFTIVPAGAPCMPQVCDSTSFCAYDASKGASSSLCYTLCPNGQSQCPSNQQCMAMDSGNGINLCVPLQGFKVVGESCVDDAECVSKVCRTYGQNRLCTSLCSKTSTANTSSCSIGFSCLTATSTTQGLCWPPLMTGGDAGVSSVQACNCDITQACNTNCACDPDCKSGCDCVVAESLSGRFELLWALPTGLLIWLLFRRSKFRRSNRVHD